MGDRILRTEVCDSRMRRRIDTGFFAGLKGQTDGLRFDESSDSFCEDIGMAADAISERASRCNGGTIICAGELKNELGLELEIAHLILENLVWNDILERIVVTACPHCGSMLIVVFDVPLENITYDGAPIESAADMQKAGIPNRFLCAHCGSEEEIPEKNTVMYRIRTGKQQKGNGPWTGLT